MSYIELLNRKIPSVIFIDFYLLMIFGVIHLDRQFHWYISLLVAKASRGCWSWDTGPKPSPQ